MCGWGRPGQLHTDRSCTGVSNPALARSRSGPPRPYRIDWDFGCSGPGRWLERERPRDPHHADPRPCPAPGRAGLSCSYRPLSLVAFDPPTPGHSRAPLPGSTYPCFTQRIHPPLNGGLQTAPHSVASGGLRPPTQWTVDNSGGLRPPLSGQWTTVGASGPHSVDSGGLRPPTQWTLSVNSSGQHGFY